MDRRKPTEAEWVALFTVRPDLLDAILNGVRSGTERYLESTSHQHRFGMCGEDWALHYKNEQINADLGLPLCECLKKTPKVLRVPDRERVCA